MAQSRLLDPHDLREADHINATHSARRLDSVARRALSHRGAARPLL